VYSSVVIASILHLFHPFKAADQFDLFLNRAFFKECISCPYNICVRDSNTYARDSNIPWAWSCD